MPDLTVDVYRVFDPDEPLPPDKPDLYVELDDVRGQAAVVQRLANAIRRSAGSTCQLLAGHRGSGKTTELLRLQSELETGTGKRYFTVFCGADEDVDRNDVDFPDVLAAIVRQMAEQIRKRAKIELKPGLFIACWERFKHLFDNKFSFETIGLEAGMLKVTAAIKSSPDARLEIRKLLEPDTGNWIVAANDVISAAALELRSKGYHGLVIIVDDLDKMVVRRHEPAGCSTAEHLFVHRQAQLSA
ncbi:MAG: AAA family ATPase, partial [Planctomycetes bacterium]|nr:AAA family ATPase [Planctomycetota bacterium]